MSNYRRHCSKLVCVSIVIVTVTIAFVLLYRWTCPPDIEWQGAALEKDTRLRLLSEIQPLTKLAGWERRYIRRIAVRGRDSPSLGRLGDGMHFFHVDVFLHHFPEWTEWINWRGGIPTRFGLIVGPKKELYRLFQLEETDYSCFGEVLAECDVKIRNTDDAKRVWAIFCEIFDVKPYHSVCLSESDNVWRIGEGESFGTRWSLLVETDDAGRVVSCKSHWEISDRMRSD